MVNMEELAVLARRLEVVTERLEAAADARGGLLVEPKVASKESLTVVVTAFDDIANGTFRAFLELCDKVGGEVAQLGPMVDKAFKAQREFLRISSMATKPSDGDLATILKPTADLIGQIQEFREKGRRAELFNHLSAVSESIPALGWVTVSPAPAPFVLEMFNAGQFYTNRVLKDFKGKAAIHVEWVKAWGQCLAELQAYVKQFHTTGLVWAKTGGDAIMVARQPNMGEAPPQGPPAGPPGAPPPPPPPPPPAMAEVPEVAPEVASRGALMQSLNAGTEITSKLKKVSDEEKTHKNPALRGDGLVKAKENGVAAPQNGNQSTKPPRLELEGKRWYVEHQKNNDCVVIGDTEPNQSVYLFKCDNSTVQVGGKCSNIIMDQCKKVGLVFQDVVAGMEVINCQSVKLQVLGSVPTISVDKTDGCQMFLSPDSLKVDIITAKSSEMNVMIPNGDEFVEQPLPEQFRTQVDGLKLKTAPTEWNIDLI